MSADSVQLYSVRDQFAADPKATLDRLAGIGFTQVEPYGLVADSYQRLLRFLSQSHEVIPFPYDWRETISNSADRLRTVLEQALSRAEAMKSAHGVAGNGIAEFRSRCLALRAGLRIGLGFSQVATRSRRGAGDTAELAIFGKCHGVW